MGLYLNGKLVGISLPQAGGGQPINNQDITVTENGTYEAEEGYTGLGEVTVDVPGIIPTGTIGITTNGIANVANYDSANVCVPITGDTISAKNVTGNTVNSDDKVWLNFDFISSDIVTNPLTYSTSNTVFDNIIDNTGNTFLIQASTSYNGSIDWQNKSLSLGSSTSLSSLQRAFYSKEGGFILDNGSSSKYYKNGIISSIGYTYYVLGGLVTNNRVNRYMTYYDCVDGVVDTSKYFTTNDATGVTTEGVFYLRTYNEWYWLNNRYGDYNIRGVKNPSFNGSTYSTDSDIVVATNGCERQVGITSDDNYVLLCDGVYNRAISSSDAATHFTILKRNGYKSFSRVTTNLPETMQYWLTNTDTHKQFLFNPLNDILVCLDMETEKKLSLYKYNSSDESWSEINITLDTIISSSTPYIKNASISSDGGSLLLQASTSASDSIKQVYGIKLAGSGGWEIVTFSSINNNSVSGYAQTTITNGSSGDVYIGTVVTPPTKKYNLLDRVTDDSNNEIGTVSGFFTDANDVEYAVVCLDAQYRLESGQWCSDNSTTVTDLPIYSSDQWGPWEAKETATFNTQKILDFCVANGYTSAACSHCRTLSFTIDGVAYYGQLPNMIELYDIVRNHTALDTADPTASSYSSVNFSTGRNRWSSSQSSSSGAWRLFSGGNIGGNAKSGTYGVVPVLEIPNT